MLAIGFPGVPTGTTFSEVAFREEIMKLQAWDPDIRSLVDRINNEDIDLQPDFQRQEVWARGKQRKLVDTILREWSIPPVHLVVTANNTLEVLDGQQRLAAIRDFLNDDIRVDGNVAPKDPSIAALHNKKYSQLPTDIRRRVDQYTLRAFRIFEYLPEEPSELFYRLNQPTGLTAGEKRNSLYGKSRSQLKDLVEHFLSLGNSRETLGFSNSRMSYDDILARLLYFLDQKTIGVKATEAAISDRFRDEEGFSEDVVEKAVAAVSAFSVRREKASAKLNKASLLSWLVFFCRAGAQNTDVNFLREFDETDALIDFERPAVASAAKALFSDRSSLRVTDVSSVVYRDFCLWFAYDALHGAPPETGLGNWLLHIRTTLSKLNKRSLEASLDLHLSTSNWPAL